MLPVKPKYCGLFKQAEKRDAHCTQRSTATLRQLLKNTTAAVVSGQRNKARNVPSGTLKTSPRYNNNVDVVPRGHISHSVDGHTRMDSEVKYHLSPIIMERTDDCVVTDTAVNMIR